MNTEDLDNAEKNIDKLFKIRDELIEGSPYLTDMKSRLQFYKKAIDIIPEEEGNFLFLIETPVNSILNLNSTNLDYSSVSATGYFYAVSADKRQIISTYGTEHYNLINEYDNLKKQKRLLTIF